MQILSKLGCNCSYENVLDFQSNGAVIVLKLNSSTYLTSLPTNFLLYTDSFQ